MSLLRGTASAPTRQYIFIGHGRSLVWLQLKDFLADRLHLDCVEFNAVSVAGRATVARLQQMLARGSLSC